MQTASYRPESEAARHPEAGFTLVEALVSLAIFSIVAVSVWTGAGLGLRAAAGIVREAKANAALSALDGLVRAEAQRIVVPFWEAPIGEVRSSVTFYADRENEADGSDRTGEETVTVLPWYRGVKDSTLRFETHGRSVAVTAAGIEISIPAESLDVELSLGPDRNRLELETNGLHGTNMIIAPFGGVPLVQTEPRGADR